MCTVATSTTFPFSLSDLFSPHLCLCSSQELEQAKFSALQKLECQKATMLTVQQDMDSLRTELKKEYEMSEDHLKQVLTSSISSTNKRLIV